ncbi:MAG: radical SAM family heme chaperone HemW [Coriobacteriales bacterium]|jgi:oxygen-independent coproporphyrinogen-3 oxidase|nr:radical SAM family heme chaperone HemW [Coriobacteriales bacterium]
MNALLNKYQALYLHIPFCASRCNYCNFFTKAIAADSSEISEYVDKLILEIRKASRAGELSNIRTIYIGGGTPSFIGQRELVRLAYALSTAMILNANTEFTVEANPDSVQAAMIRDLYSLGVNRFSLGVQSFNNNELVALGRRHSSAQAKAAIEVIQERCENVSIDLMCGIPLQTINSWQQTLTTAINTEVKHISVYPLSIEENTPLYESIRLHDIADEDIQADMMLKAAELLTAAAYNRYEIASFAKQGFKCKHNIAYWTGVPYLGIGTAAAGMRHLTDGRERLLDGKVIETLNKKESILEDVMLALRMTNGVSDSMLKLAYTYIPKLAQTITSLYDQGLLRRTADAYCLSKRGWLLGNLVFAEIWSLA